MYTLAIPSATTGATLKTVLGNISITGIDISEGVVTARANLSLTPRVRVNIDMAGDSVKGVDHVARDDDLITMKLEEGSCKSDDDAKLIFEAFVAELDKRFKMFSPETLERIRAGQCAPVESAMAVSSETGIFKHEES